MFSSLAKFLDAHDFFCNTRPSTLSPEAIVELGISNDRIHFGLSVGHIPYPTVPDYFVGVIDEHGTWHWPNDQIGIVHNLHSSRACQWPSTLVSGWPVWLTITCHTTRDRLRRRCTHVDLFALIQKQRRQHFWDLSFKEFIESTWHPSRLVTWCLDTEDASDFFVIL